MAPAALFSRKLKALAVVITLTATSLLFVSYFGASQAFLLLYSKLAPMPPSTHAVAPFDPAVALVYISSKEKSVHCSAAFISQGTLLTAAHCLAFNTSKKEINVAPGAYSRKGKVIAPFGYCAALSWKTAEGYKHHDERASKEKGLYQSDFSNDYAIVTVNKSCVSEYVKLKPFELSSPRFTDTSKVFSDSYPGSELAGTPIKQGGVLLPCLFCEKDSVVASNVKAVPGSSGGPLWVEEKGQRKIIAVTTGEGRVSSIHRYVDQELLTFIKENS